jgi:perosamine synthetase
MSRFTRVLTHRHLTEIGAAAGTGVPFIPTSAGARPYEDYHQDAGNDSKTYWPGSVSPKQILNHLKYITPLIYSDARCRACFEHELTSFLGGRVDVLTLGRARTGIYLLVKSVVRPNRNGVILSPYTIPDVIKMVQFAGGRPIFVDNLPRSTNVDLDHLSKLINPSIACVLTTHYHVTQNNLTEILVLCRSNDVPLFDDCALAIGTQYRGSYLGTCTDASVFSMSAFKTLNYFLGGAITTLSPAIFAAISQEVRQWPELRASQYVAAVIRTALYDFATKPLIFSCMTFPFRRRSVHQRADLPAPRINNKTLDQSLLSRPSQAAMWELRRKLPSLVPQLAHRRSISTIYDLVLGDRFISDDTDTQVRRGSSFCNYPIFVDRQYRQAVYRSVIASGFDIGLSLYSNVHEMTEFKGVKGKSRNVSELVRSVLTLPTHSRITKEYAWRLAYTVSNAISVECRRRV